MIQLEVYKRDYKILIDSIYYSVYFVLSNNQLIRGVSFILDIPCKNNNFELPNTDLIKNELEKELLNKNLDGIKAFLYHKEFLISDHDKKVYNMILEKEREINLNKILGNYD